MTITYFEIIKFLDINKVTYELKGEPLEQYLISSIFSPIENGFYFLTDHTKIIRELKSSLFLINENILPKDENVFIVIEENPQLVYYQLLDFYFKENSTGKICDTVKIHEEAQIGKNVQIDSFTVINKCIIGDNTIIKSHCVINDNTSIGCEVLIEPHCNIGARGVAWIWDNKGGRILQPQIGGVIIGNNTMIGSNSVIVRGSLNENTIVGENTVIAPGARLGHGSNLGKFSHLANNVVTGGNVIIHENCFIGSSVTLRPKVEIHPNTIIGAGALVIKNTTGKGFTLKGVPAKEYKSKKNSSGVPNFKRI